MVAYRTAGIFPLRIPSERLRVFSIRSGTAENDFGQESFSEKWIVVDDADWRAFAEFRGIDELRVLDKAGARIPSQRHRLRIIPAAQLKGFRILVHALNDARCIPAEPRQRERFGTARDECGEEQRNEKAALFHNKEGAVSFRFRVFALLNCRWSR